MKSTKKQIIIVFAILMLALVLSCAFVACNKTEPDKEDVCEHVEVTDNAVEPTCTEKGLTEGTHCSKCGKILQAQNEIPALGHKYGDIIPKTEPTCSEKGVEAHYKCSVCNKVFKNDEHKTETTLDELTIAINPNAHNFGNWIKNEGADTHTRVCSYNNEHTETENCHGGTATCTKQAVCEKCKAKYGKLAEHDYKDGHCTVCGIRSPSEGLTYSLNSDGNGYIVTGIGTCADKELIIPSEYNAKPVTSIGERAFKDCYSLTSVTIPDSVTSIGENAFDGCYSLTSVTIPDSVTSIGSGTFRYCTGLTSVTIGNSVTSIGGDAFYGCTGLTSVTIGNSVTSIGGDAFYNTAWYNKQPDGLVYAGKVAYKYKGTMPSNTSIVLKEGTLGIANSAFYGCSGLTSITIPDSVTSIGYGTFYNCTGLTSITIPNSVTSIGNNAFYNCTGLTSVTIPDSVTSIGRSAFEGCKGLTNITIPDSVTSIGYGAFEGCAGLTSVTIPDSVTSIGERAFYNTAWYNNQPDGLVYAGKVAYKYKGTMPSNTSIVLKEGTLGITDYAFRGCKGLTSATIPNSVTSIGDYAFMDCTGLTSVTIPGSVKSIGWGAFAGCTGLTSVTIPDSVTSIGNNAFYKCTGLTSVTIPDSVTSIGGSAFGECTRLTSIKFNGTKAQWNAVSKGSNWKYNVPSACKVICTDGTVSI